MAWDKTTGNYIVPPKTWQLNLDEIRGRQDIPDVWLSRTGGHYHLAMAFHFPPYNFPKGTGAVGHITFCPSPFRLRDSQDPYNKSWNVAATTGNKSSLMEYWDWLPGVLLVDQLEQFTLPDDELSRYAGTSGRTMTRGFSMAYMMNRFMKRN